MTNSIIIDLDFIKAAAEDNAVENDDFRSFLKSQDGANVDELFNSLNDSIAPKINCTKCGNCCRTFMINVDASEIPAAAKTCNVSAENFTEQYLEQSHSGEFIINSIPCHFLTENKCSIYNTRFTECREFPHLHKPNIRQRLFGLLMYYATCPIVYNVIEEAKIKSGFKTSAINKNPEALTTTV